MRKNSVLLIMSAGQITPNLGDKKQQFITLLKSVGRHGDKLEQEGFLYSVILGLGWKPRVRGLGSLSMDFLEVVHADCGLRGSVLLDGPPTELDLDTEVTQRHPCHTLVWSSHRPPETQGQATDSTT